VRVDGLTEDVFERTADVVVVGSGAAGCAAAVTAARAGAEVLVLERAGAVGGTTALSGGGAWIPNNSLMRARGVEDPKPEAMRLMARLAYPHLFDTDAPFLGIPVDVYGLIEVFYDEGAAAIDSFMAAGAADYYSDMHLPDYYAELPENRAPYGRKISPAIRKVSHDAAGPSLIRQMLDVAEQHGATVRTDHRVVSLLQNNGGDVVGVEVRGGRHAHLVRARQAVVFASGGFLHDPDLVREYLIGPAFGGCAVAGATGDFVRIGIEAGAQLANMGQAWWYQVVLDHAARNRQTAGGLFMPFGDSMIQVNRHGRRVMNEKAPYNERGPVHFSWDGREYPNLVLFQIYDDAVATNPDPIGYRWPIPPPGEKAGYVISGATLDELAANIDIRLERFRSHIGGLRLSPDFVANLRASLDRYNGFARTGVDRDFGRGEAAISHYWSGRAREGANNTMHPFLATGPYHCILLVAGALDTKGGPKINTRAQVLDTHGEPISGLYGAGNCVGSATGQAYWGPGGTIGPALVFGYIAGRHAAKEPEKPLCA
jgi:succinate dehydrogenase/fumarate reductase flavoprotein subunit